jgi:hypothetical protein
MQRYISYDLQLLYCKDFLPRQKARESVRMMDQSFLSDTHADFTGDRSANKARKSPENDYVKPTYIEIVTSDGVGQKFTPDESGQDTIENQKSKGSNITCFVRKVAGPRKSCLEKIRLSFQGNKQGSTGSRDRQEIA